MPDDPVLLSITDHVATLTLNRPDSLNAASEELMTALERQLHVIAAAAEVRCVILTGAGRAFSAGGDLLEFEALLKAGGSALIDTLRYNQQVIQMIEDLKVPVIGAVNGVAVAGGLELLLSCDIIIAAEGVRLGDGHARYGVVPAGGATVRLVERIGRGRAAQLFYTAGLVDAASADKWGLVNEVVPKDALAVRAREIAGEICQASPEAIHHIRILNHPGAADASRQRRLQAELKQFEQHLLGMDLAEGLAAFEEKRTAKYGVSR